MNRRRNAGLIASIGLGLALFAPVYYVPVVGSVQLLNVDVAPAVAVLGIVAFVASCFKAMKVLWFTGGLTIFFAVGYVHEVTTRVGGIRADMMEKLADNPFRGLAMAATAGSKIEWGIPFIMACGVLMMVAASKMLEERNAVDR